MAGPNKGAKHLHLANRLGCLQKLGGQRSVEEGRPRNVSNVSNPGTHLKFHVDIPHRTALQIPRAGMYCLEHGLALARDSA